AEAFGDVLAGGGGAVDGADDGDVVAAAVAQMLGPVGAAVVTHPEARFGSRRRRRAIAAERVVALERIGADTMPLHVIPGRDVLAGEADDLAVLVHRRTFL